MACEDYPCCGHEAGCCPDFNESGRQLNMRCTCGAILPVDNPVSICNACLHQDDMGARPWDNYNEDANGFHGYDEPMEDQWIDAMYEE